MKLLVINPTHPLTPHISAVRAWRFSVELAKRGHQVVLLCAALEDGQASDSTELARHDWQSPFVLACERGRTGRLDKDKLPLVFRKALTVWRMLRRGGDVGEWADNAVQTAQQLADTFRPDVIWTTFGMMEAVIAARRIARDTPCPWVLDIKDNWALYVPPGLRRIMALRTGGWAALTVNARFTQQNTRRWQRKNATVVYSGVDESFFCAPADSQVQILFCINLIGGLYFSDRLQDLLAGIKQWAADLSPSERSLVRLCYLGGDSDLFAEHVAQIEPGIAVEMPGYLPVAELARHCRDAAVNAYIAHPDGFHHKLLELLSCGRPLLAFPAETEEAHELARQVEGDLRTPANAYEVAVELAKLHSQWRTQSASPARPVAASLAYSWPEQTETLEQVLQSAADRVKQDE